MHVIQLCQKVTSVPEEEAVLALEGGERKEKWGGRLYQALAVPSHSAQPRATASILQRVSHTEPLSDLGLRVTA